MTRYAGDAILKDPASDEPQAMDWTLWLAEIGVGVTVATSDWVVTGRDSALTLHDATIVAGSLKTQVFLEGGTSGVLYTVTNQITTNSTPVVTDERSFFVRVEQR